MKLKLYKLKLKRAKNKYLRPSLSDKGIPTSREYDKVGKMISQKPSKKAEQTWAVRDVITSAI